LTYGKVFPFEGEISRTEQNSRYGEKSLNVLGTEIRKRPEHSETSLNFGRIPHESVSNFSKKILRRFADTWARKPFGMLGRVVAIPG